jgi:MFS family permease
MTESGLFPGVVFYLSMWYKRKERQYRIALFFSAASLAGAFGGILAWGIAHMAGVGGLHGWRWIFILVGRRFARRCNFSNFIPGRYTDSFGLSRGLFLHLQLSIDDQLAIR